MLNSTKYVKKRRIHMLIQATLIEKKYSKKTSDHIKDPALGISVIGKK